MEFSPSHCSHVVPFSLSLVEERGQVLPMETDQLTLEAWWMNTPLVGLSLSDNKEELKGTEKNIKQLNLSK